MPRIMLIAGEASGDLHGGGVVRELRALYPQTEIFGIGGDKMQAEGMRLLHHVREMSFLGFAEVIKHLPFIRKVLRECEREIVARKPDVLLLIDYPGFNLKLARMVRRHNVPVIYYISPQVWAWHASRVKQMKTLIDKMLVIFPFEVPIYEHEHIPVEFVGHPLLEQIKTDADPAAAKENFFRQNGFDPSKPLVGVFPGSRKQEIERMLPVYAAAIERLQGILPVQAAVGAAPTVPLDLIRSYLKNSSIKILQDQSASLQRYADVAITKSGTSTLELAIAGTPMVVSYKTSALSYAIGRTLAQVDMIALPNIVAGKKIVPEFIQKEATSAHIFAATADLLRNDVKRTQVRRDLADVRSKLGSPGASRRVAEVIAKYLK
ncbi:MAG TPA: lipid-A-disaccharide synthase [Candidatus Kapabacteria bacterium]|nr:lipid-A-disaccharide synthase [Candidatus Kapabacteria bacterium]